MRGQLDAASRAVEEMEPDAAFQLPERNSVHPCSKARGNAFEPAPLIARAPSCKGFAGAEIEQTVVAADSRGWLLMGPDGLKGCEPKAETLG